MKPIRMRLRTCVQRHQQRNVTRGATTPEREPLSGNELGIENMVSRLALQGQLSSGLVFRKSPWFHLVLKHFINFAN
jgi:hypothetical protein